jgi:hypothetical protein
MDREMKFFQWRCGSGPPPSILQRSRTLGGGRWRSSKVGGSKYGLVLELDEQVLRRKKGVFIPHHKMLPFEILSPTKAGQGLEKASHLLFPLKNLDKSPPPI